MLMMETEAHGGYVIYSTFSTKNIFPSLFCFRHSFRFRVIPLNETSQKNMKTIDCVHYKCRRLLPIKIFHLGI